MEPRQFCRVQQLDRASERLDASRTSLDEEAPPLRGGDDSGQSPVVRIRFSLDETVLLETGDDLGHCRWSHLLGARELTEGDWPAKHDH